MSIELKIFSEALYRVWNNLDSSLRALLGRCQIKIEYINHPQDGQNNAIERRIYLEAPNQTILKRLSKRLEALMRRFDSLLGDTSIFLSEKGSCPSKAFDRFGRAYVVKKVIQIDSSTFCLCRSSDSKSFAITNSKWIRRSAEHEERQENPVPPYSPSNLPGSKKTPKIVGRPPLNPFGDEEEF